MLDMLKKLYRATWCWLDDNAAVVVLVVCFLGAATGSCEPNWDYAY